MILCLRHGFRAEQQAVAEQVRHLLSFPPRPAPIAYRQASNWANSAERVGTHSNANRTVRKYRQSHKAIKPFFAVPLR
jgi:hypothetical protein